MQSDFQFRQLSAEYLQLQILVKVQTIVTYVSSLPIFLLFIDLKDFLLEFSIKLKIGD